MKVCIFVWARFVAAGRDDSGHRVRSDSSNGSAPRWPHRSAAYHAALLPMPSRPQAALAGDEPHHKWRE
jgi:hypothetical protein